jgi:hypothetical protein
MNQVHEIERHRESLLIVGHQGVLRMLLAYYQGVPREQAPYLELALNHVHTVFMLERKGALFYNPSLPPNKHTHMPELKRDGMFYSDELFSRGPLSQVLTLKPRTYGCVTTTTNLMASVQLGDDGQKDM